MRIRVTEVERRGHETWVTFTADVGEGCGRWASKDAPVAGGSCHVELDIPDPIREFRVLPAGTAPSLALDSEGVTVTAHVLSVDDDGVAAISLGGHIVLVELEASAGEHVAFATTSMGVYPYRL